MKYVRLETYVKIASDQNVDDLATVKSIFKTLKEKRLDCSIQIAASPKVSQARIIKVDTDTFDILIIKNNTSLEKTCKYTDVNYLSVNTSDSELVKNQTEVSRWMLINPVSFD